MDNELARENALLRRQITVLEQREAVINKEYRRVRQRLAEWEGSMERQMGKYHHGDRTILPFIDGEDFGGGV